MPFGDFFMECAARPQRHPQRRAEQPAGRSAMQSPQSLPRRGGGGPGSPTDVALSGLGGAGATDRLGLGAAQGPGFSPKGYQMGMMLDTGYLSPPGAGSVRVREQAAVQASAFRLG